MGKEDKNQNRQRQYIANSIQKKSLWDNAVAAHLVKARHFCTTYKIMISVFECADLFFFHFDISKKFVRTSLAKKCEAGIIIQPDLRGKHQAKNKTDEMIEQHARQHILSIQCVESHYCRKSSKKLYLPSQLNLERLYTLYLEKCKDDNKKSSEEKSPSLIKPVSKSLYKKYFYSFGNLAFHKPKKDQCNTCNRYNQLTDEEKKLKRLII